MKKNTYYLIAGIIIIALGLWAYITLTGAKGEQIHILVDGEEYGVYSLNKDQVIRINDTNACRIENNQVTMIVATCPDHLCMMQRPVGKNGGMIVCLPNKVIIETVDNKYVEPLYEDDDLSVDTGV